MGASVGLLLALFFFIPSVSQEEGPVARLLEADPSLEARIEQESRMAMDRFLEARDPSLSVEEWLLVNFVRLTRYPDDVESTMESGVDAEQAFVMVEAMRRGLRRLVERLPELDVEEDARRFLRGRLERRIEELARAANTGARRLLEEREHRKDPADSLDAGPQHRSLVEAGAREGWPQHRGAADHDNYRRTDNPIRAPRILWKTERGPVPAVVGEDVYAGGASLRRIGLRDGRVRGEWSPHASGASGGSIETTPVVLDDRVITHLADGRVFALDLGLTEPIWVADAAASRLFPAAFAEGLYVVATDGGVVALSAQDGSRRWAFGGDPPVGVQQSPAIAEGKVLFGTTGGTFFALDLATGAPIWTFKSPHEFGWTDPVCAFGKVFVGDRGGVIHAIDLETGKGVWERISGATGLSAPGILPGHVVVGYGRVVTTFDQETGVAGRRRFETGLNPFGSPTLVGKTLIFGDLDGRLYAFDYRKEALDWTFEVVGERAQVHGFVVHRGVLLVSTSDGVYALANDPDARRIEGAPLNVRSDSLE